jgi:hypothetical protein
VRVTVSVTVAVPTSGRVGVDTVATVGLEAGRRATVATAATVQAVCDGPASAPVKPLCWLWFRAPTRWPRTDD